MIEGVCCPLVIFPSDMTQLKVSLTDGSVPDTFAEKVRLGPLSDLGQETTTTGQLCEYARSAAAERTRSNKSKEM
jgi:hypothetical protein